MNDLNNSAHVPCVTKTNHSINHINNIFGQLTKLMCKQIFAFWFTACEENKTV